MKKLTGKLLELTLLMICFALFVIVLPDWICLLVIGGAITLCIVSMISSNFFGRF